MRVTAAALAAAVCAAALVTGCAPTPTPVVTPSPVATGYASDEDAFAAAEATYRAYIDAVNARRENPDSRPDPTDYLTGEALTAEIAADAKFLEAGIVLDGPVLLAEVRGVSAAPTSVELSICLDVSQTRVVDSSGADVTPADRGDRLGLTIDVVWSSERPYITGTVASDEQC